MGKDAALVGFGLGAVGLELVDRLWAVYWGILVREGGCEDFGYFGGMGLVVLLDCAIQDHCFLRNMRLLIK